MKKVISLVLSVLLVMTALVPMTALAAPFTSSPSSSGGIQVEEQDYNGNKHNALIVEGFDWDTVIGGVADGDLIITPSTDIESAPDEVDKERFEKAKNELVNGNLSDIDPSIAADAVIKDIFDVTVTGEYDKALEDGNSLKITFKVGNVDGTLKALVYGKNGWELVQNIKNNGDGTVTLLLSSEGPVAFIVEPSGVTSPATSDSSVVYLGISVVAVALAFACVAAMKNGKKVTE